MMTPLPIPAKNCFRKAINPGVRGLRNLIKVEMDLELSKGYTNPVVCHSGPLLPAFAGTGFAGASFELESRR